MEPSTAIIDSAKYGKVPRSVGMAKKWEEISGGVWCCPVKVKAAIKDAATCTALACSLLGIFYPEEELKERRLHELDRDVVEAITEAVNSKHPQEEFRCPHPQCQCMKKKHIIGLLSKEIIFVKKNFGYI